MSRFKTRIEFKNPTEKELEKVKAEMVKLGFIAGERVRDALTFLPPPHFDTKDSSQIHVVKELANTATRKTGINVKISVSEGND